MAALDTGGRFVCSSGYDPTMEFQGGYVSVNTGQLCNVHPERTNEFDEYVWVTVVETELSGWVPSEVLQPFVPPNA